MTLFDRYIAVDWSAANERRVGADSIWIADRGPEGREPSINPPTRDEATSILRERLLTARGRGERVFVGFDFVFGYPRGTARAIAGHAGWRALWDAIGAAVVDGPDNRSNRFEVAAQFNRVLDLPHFWGHPRHHIYADLKPLRPDHGYRIIAERRRAEAAVRGPQPVWKLTGVGSVGSQTLLGIPRVDALRQAIPDSAVWPFETAFDAHLAPVTFVEIYPSMFPLADAVEPRDREQVETYVDRCAELDRADRLGSLLAAPPNLDPDARRDVLEEEGWIAGAGHPDLLASLRPAYLRDPAAITERSFAIIASEADLSSLPAALHPIATRMIHACGMTDIVGDLRASRALPLALSRAIAAGAPIFCDCEAVRAGITSKLENPRRVTLNDPEVPAIARRLGTTRSAAALEHWRPDLAGAIVVIGNAPTALFHLLDMLANGAPRPAAIIATPVGFVGAAESKQALVDEVRDIPYVTLLGRRGGSAMAAAALNAVALGTTA